MDPSNVPQNEPNFWVGLESYLLPLRGPRTGPEVQNLWHLWLPGTGWVSTTDEPNSQGTCHNQQLVPSSALLSKDPANRPLSSHEDQQEGAGLQRGWEMWWPSHLWEPAPEEPRPLGFLGNNIPPPVYPHSFFTPSGIQEEASTVALSAETCLLE